MRTDLTIQKRKILIIDDNADLLDILKEYLGQSGFEVRITQTAINVFHTVEQFRPDLVVLDYLLDGINGGEICHQLKTSAFGKTMPVILFSAYPRVFLSLGTYGCDLFIPKPFDLDHFLSSIEQLLQATTNHLQSDPPFQPAGAASYISA